MFEEIVGYYSRKDLPRPETYTDLYGLKFCRPEGYSLFMMEEELLTEPHISIARPLRVIDCFRGLANGDYDVVVLAVDSSERAIAELGAGDKIVRHEHLSYVVTIHAVIAKNNPRKDHALGALNDGIRKLKANGEWFSIVTRHMAEHSDRTKSE